MISWWSIPLVLTLLSGLYVTWIAHDTRAIPFGEGIALLLSLFAIVVNALVWAVAFIIKVIAA